MHAARAVEGARAICACWATGLVRRFGLHVIAVLLGIILMLPFYWAVIGSLKQMTEVRQIPLIWWPSSPAVGQLRRTCGTCASSRTGF